jgi:hypothetical protein
MKNEKNIFIELCEIQIRKRDEIPRAMNKKIEPPKLHRRTGSLEKENEWHQEYKLIYDAYILEEDY